MQVNMATGQGLHDCFDTLKDVDVIVNCAAISSPAACAKHPQHARSVLVPPLHEMSVRQPAGKPAPDCGHLIAAQQAVCAQEAMGGLRRRPFSAAGPSTSLPS